MENNAQKKSWPPGDLPYAHNSMDLKSAVTLMEGAQGKARELGFAITTAVCDAGGNLVAVQKMDDAALLTLEIAQNKAKSAVYGKMPTALWQQSFKGPSAELIPLYFHSDWITFIGGFPVIIDKQLIGGFGISGATWEDGLIARAGLEALGAETQGVDKCLEIMGPPKEMPKLRYTFPGW